MHDFEIYIHTSNSYRIHRGYNYYHYYNENKGNYLDNSIFEKNIYISLNMFLRLKDVNPWVLSTFPFEITHIFFCHVRFSFKY